jgi:hypothetical protein
VVKRKPQLKVEGDLADPGLVKGFQLRNYLAVSGGTQNSRRLSGPAQYDGVFAAGFVVNGRVCGLGTSVRDTDAVSSNSDGSWRRS